jgi:hypothetical protein
MSNRWWNPFDGMEQMAFKPLADGYVYRAPNPWLFGPGRYYLVNEAQKAALVVHHRRMMQLMFWGIIAMVMIGVPLTGLFLPHRSGTMMGVSALVGLALGLCLNLLLVRRIEPIVATLPPTSARITQGDAFKRQVAIFSRRYLLGFAALDFVLLALVVSTAVFGSTGWDLMAIVGSLLFGAGMIYFLVLYVAKRRQAEI